LLVWKRQEVQKMSLSKLTKKWVASKLPKRPKDANKGTFGKVLVIAGSENYPGAAYLCCAAAYRTGAGLVTLATTDSVKVIVSRKLPEVTLLSLDEVFDKLNEYDVLLIGPGLGQSGETVVFVKQLIKEKLPKTVIDGDGLNILSKMESWWERLREEVVLTPHPGEMVRLTGLSIKEIQSNRESIAIRFAKKWKKVVVLKGANTVIASPGGEVAVSPFANPALATAGTGDILAGILAGLIAQKMDLFDAAGAAIYLHGQAGEKLKEEFTEGGAIASDLLKILPQVLKSLKE